MKDCERMMTCAFYHDALSTMPMVSDIYKDYYCRGDNSECAIRMIATVVGEQRLPPDLFPNQTVRARKLIAQVPPVAAAPAAD